MITINKKYRGDKSYLIKIKCRRGLLECVAYAPNIKEAMTETALYFENNKMNDVFSDSIVRNINESGVPSSMKFVKVDCNGGSHYFNAKKISYRELNEGDLKNYVRDTALRTMGKAAAYTRDLIHKKQDDLRLKTVAYKPGDTTKFTFWYYLWYVLENVNLFNEKALENKSVNFEDNLEQIDRTVKAALPIIRDIIIANTDGESFSVEYLKVLAGKSNASYIDNLVAEIKSLGRKSSNAMDAVTVMQWVQAARILRKAFGWQWFSSQRTNAGNLDAEYWYRMPDILAKLSGSLSKAIYDDEDLYSKDFLNKCYDLRNYVGEIKKLQIEIYNALKKYSGYHKNKTIAESVKSVRKPKYRMISESVKATNKGKINEAKKDTYRGVPGTVFIWHGEWSDAEIYYRDELINANDVEDTMWSHYKDDCKESGKRPTEQDFDKWVDEQGVGYIKSLLDEIVWSRSESDDDYDDGPYDIY